MLNQQLDEILCFKNNMILADWNMLGDTVVRIGVDIRYLGYEYTGIPVFIYDILKYWNKLYKNECNKKEQ